MPPRAPPKVYHFLLKTHKLTIFLTAPPSTLIASLKQEALAALTSDVNQVEDVPRVNSDDDFELCKAIKEKGRNTGNYEVLDALKDIKVSGLANWEPLYLRFRDQSGNLLPVEFTQASLTYDDEEEQRQNTMSFDESSTVSKGKRKAPPE